MTNLWGFFFSFCTNQFAVLNLGGKVSRFANSVTSIVNNNGIWLKNEDTSKKASSFCLFIKREPEQNTAPTKKLLQSSSGSLMVTRWRFELQTHCLKGNCSANWASGSNGWDGRTRTYECQSQSLVPYHLATSQYWHRYIEKKWGGWRDSNPRSSEPQSDALTS